MIIYNFYNAPDLKVYAGAGVKLNFSLYPTNVYTVSSDNQGKITPEGTSSEGEANGKLSAQSIYPTIPIKAGVFISKNIDIYVAYYALGYLTDYVLTRGSETGYQVGLNYIFGK
jgi:hypothetical protein